MTNEEETFLLLQRLLQAKSEVMSHDLGNFDGSRTYEVEKKEIFSVLTRQLSSETHISHQFTKTPHLSIAMQIGDDDVTLLLLQAGYSPFSETELSTSPFKAALRRESISLSKKALHPTVLQRMLQSSVSLNIPGHVIWDYVMSSVTKERLVLKPPVVLDICRFGNQSMHNTRPVVDQWACIVSKNITTMHLPIVQYLIQIFNMSNKELRNLTRNLLIANLDFYFVYLTKCAPKHDDALSFPRDGKEKNAKVTKRDNNNNIADATEQTTQPKTLAQQQNVNIDILRLLDRSSADLKTGSHKTTLSVYQQSKLAKFFDWLLPEITNPLSLCELTRKAIQANVNTSLEYAVPQLGLPTLLTAYLLLKEFDKDIRQRLM